MLRVWEDTWRSGGGRSDRRNEEEPTPCCLEDWWTARTWCEREATRAPPVSRYRQLLEAKWSQIPHEHTQPLPHTLIVALSRPHYHYYRQYEEGHTPHHPIASHPLRCSAGLRLSPWSRPPRLNEAGLSSTWIHRRRLTCWCSHWQSFYQRAVVRPCWDRLQSMRCEALSQSKVVGLPWPISHAGTDTQLQWSTQIDTGWSFIRLFLGPLLVVS